MYKLVLRLLRRTYGHMPAKDFGPLCLKAVMSERVVPEINQRTRCPAERWTTWPLGTCGQRRDHSDPRNDHPDHAPDTPTASKRRIIVIP